MCGICGIVRFDALSPDDAPAVSRMVSYLRHRGPDDEGVWTAPRVALGHNRLSIIDIAGGHQPMFNETGDIALVFNGEIYNFADLRGELIRAGHDLRTRSDTEVIVHGYEQWGTGLLNRLRGMFAFALWDATQQRLLLARDRLGEKPLYFYLPPAGDSIHFASEIKALVSLPGVPRQLNYARLAEYLTFRCVSGTATLFDQVHELEPASFMIIAKGKRHQEKYWSPDVPVLTRSAGESSVQDGERLLDDAIACRLVSDVAIGTLTSGGLDSSLVTAIASAHAPDRLDTFCVGFDDPVFDERPFARRVADHIGSRHHEIDVRANDLDAELDRLTWAHDEPLTHPNSIPMHLLFRHAKQSAGVTVMLSGEGADELFGGYGWYRTVQRREKLTRVPMAAPLLRAAAGRRFRVLQKVLDPDYLVVSNATVEPLFVAELLGRPSGVADIRRAFWPTRGTDADALFLYDQSVYLPPLLQRQDRMSMAAGVEARVVFLDAALVHWANALPSQVKLSASARKPLLKAMAAKWLPSSIVNREKTGFTLPLGRWLREGGPLASRVRNLRESNAFVRQLVVPAQLDTLLDEHSGGRANHADIIWTLVALETWANTFLGRSVRSEMLPGASSSLISPARASNPDAAGPRTSTTEGVIGR